MGDLAQHPLGQDHLVGRIHRVDRQELDLLLDHLAALDDEVSDLGVGVFDGAPHTHQVKQGFGAHVLPLRERTGLVIAALLFDTEEGFAEGLEGATRVFLESALCFAQDLLGGRGQGGAVDVVEAAEEFQGGDGGEGAQERRRQARDDVEVRGGRVDEGEQGGAVDTFAEGEDTVEVRL